MIYNVGYSYDSAGRLCAAYLSRPAGRVAYTLRRPRPCKHGQHHQRAARRRPSVANVAYHPFGGVKGYTLGNGQVYTRGIDLDGRIASYTLGAQTFGIGYDAASRISLDHRPRRRRQHQHLRLRQPRPADQRRHARHALRLHLRRGRQPHLEDRGLRPSYLHLQQHLEPHRDRRRAQLLLRRERLDHRGRQQHATPTTCAAAWCRRRASIGATSYKVNALGQRIRKTNSLGDTVFHYDTNGR